MCIEAYGRSTFCIFTVFDNTELIFIQKILLKRESYRKSYYVYIPVYLKEKNHKTFTIILFEILCYI